MQPITKLQLGLWLPFVFSIALSGIALNASMFSKTAISPGFVPFLCFLPMAFYFVAWSSASSVSQLHKRLDELETRLKKFDH